VTPHLRTAGLLAALAAAGLALPAPAADYPDAKAVKEVRDKAYAFLKAAQDKDGSFPPNRFRPGVTALVVAGLARNGYAADDPVMKKALAYLTKQVKNNGGIYDKGLANYTTSVAVMALADINADHRYDTILKNAAAFLRTIQANDIPAGDVKYGGVNYGKGQGAVDMSNTTYFVEALIRAGVPKNDPAVQRALTFMTRCQNFQDKEEGSDQAFAKKARPEDVGGFVYRPDPDDKRHATEGGLRSLGAMTYAGLKSFLYAGVKKDDPRVRAATKWIRQHYTLEENPGEKQQGLYYYYHTFAKAMEALGEDPFKDARGKEHAWRKELFEALKKRQQADGSFVNKGDRVFGEADPRLATAFALLGLSYTSPKGK
jgi:squalene-hopene/tetraprenyl-beta-curcumene cyclase